jgi:hypothetical protein
VYLYGLKVCGVGEVSGRGKGEGISSTPRVSGLCNGPPRVGGVALPFACAPLGGCAPAGVGGGEVPSLLRSLRVMCGRD